MTTISTLQPDGSIKAGNRQMINAIVASAPTFVSLASAGTAQIPMSLAIFSFVIFVIYLIGALTIPETKGNFH
jgi:hypothetical protein